MINQTLENWDQILAEFEGPNVAGDWLFRGERDSSWTLKTTLERHTPVHILRSRAEQKLFTEFRRRAHFYLDSQLIPESKNTAEWLALMQHFGAPTRLLDVTRSPYLALYFAVEHGNNRGSSSVWAVNRSWCLIAAGEAIFRATPGAREAIKKRIGSRYPHDMQLALAQGLDASRLKDDLWRKKAATLVVPFVPDKLSPRLSVQQGAFLVPRSVDAPFDENLAALGDSGGYVRKYEIPNSQRGRILERLRLMNITREQLFPGLDGFAQSFQQFLYGETDEERGAREARATLQVQKAEQLRAQSRIVAGMAADEQNHRNEALFRKPAARKRDGGPTEE